MALISRGREQGGESGKWIWRGKQDTNLERTALCWNVLAKAVRRKRWTSALKGWK